MVAVYVTVMEVAPMLDLSSMAPTKMVLTPGSSSNGRGRPSIAGSEENAAAAQAVVPSHGVDGAETVGHRAGKE